MFVRNEAARMESTGLPNMIHVSQVTANLLISEGKSHWLRKREDFVEAKGKGRMVTFWLNPNFKKNDSSSSKSPSENAPSNNSVDEMTDDGNQQIKLDDELSKRDRLVDWMVELLSEYLQRMVSSCINMYFI